MNAKVGRRDFIKLAAVGTAVSTITIAAKGNPLPKEAGSSPHRWAMVIDQAKCVGCAECSLACQAHNDTREDAPWNRMIELKPISGEAVYAPVPCMHCENAPCVDICPVGATYHRPDGIVMMDYDKCIGCRYCQLACPYGARTFNWETHTGENTAVPEWGEPEVERRTRGVAEKCTFCFHRIDRGLAEGLTPGIDRQATPACVAACPVGARLFGNLNDPGSPVSQALAKYPSIQLRQDLGTNPRVYYLPARREDDENIEEGVS
ncbi:sulfate reduction electron transfer complex DsrMKJOP subunit DsrO [Candidatus Leptofilum sp.]|uniref:sulfate reduction electron transfer complex DsrMKJOP subunit DsrO n=1 Tax=Candidatus Leptofilum sp. TaxID=3241576 RepID=UPI003B5ABAF2